MNLDYLNFLNICLGCMCVGMCNPHNACHLPGWRSKDNLCGLMLFFTTCSLVTDLGSSGLAESTFTRRAMSPVPKNSSSDEKQAKIVLNTEFLENPWVAATSIMKSPRLALLSFSEDLIPRNDTCKPAGYKFLLRMPSQLGVGARVYNPKPWKLQGGCHLRPARST